MRFEETFIYNEALDQYCQIIRHGGNDLEEIRNCLKTMEYFEDYEKCRDLAEIIKAYEITLTSQRIKKENPQIEKSQ